MDQQFGTGFNVRQTRPLPVDYCPDTVKITVVQRRTTTIEERKKKKKQKTHRILLKDQQLTGCGIVKKGRDQQQQKEADKSDLIDQ